MKRNIILTPALLIVALVMTACTDLTHEEKKYRELISDICLEWGADKQAVDNYMKGKELKYEGDSVMDYFLSDKNQVVVYQFDDGKLCYSMLRVKGSTELSMRDVLKGWDYLGSELYFDEGTMITSMVDIYIKREKDMLVTTYTIQDNGVEYRILGFASLKDLW